MPSQDLKEEKCTALFIKWLHLHLINTGTKYCEQSNPILDVNWWNGSEKHNEAK